MATKKTKLEFRIIAKIISMSSIVVHADSFEDALAQSKDLKEDDFITFNGEHIDSEIGIQGFDMYPKALHPRSNATI